MKGANAPSGIRPPDDLSWGEGALFLFKQLGRNGSEASGDRSIGEIAGIRSGPFRREASLRDLKFCGTNCDLAAFP